MHTHVGVSAILAALIGSTVQAAEPVALLESSQQVQASGQAVQVWRLPTLDANGKLTFWDVTLNLGIDRTGRPASVAINAVVSPMAMAAGLDALAGAYSASLDLGKDSEKNKDICAVTVGVLEGGRREAAFSCVAPLALSGTWTSGPIKGHPLELELEAAGIADIGGYRQYAWGKVASGGPFKATCLAANKIIGVRQLGTQIAITSYGDDNVADCGLILSRQDRSISTGATRPDGTARAAPPAPGASSSPVSAPKATASSGQAAAQGASR